MTCWSSFIAPIARQHAAIKDLLRRRDRWADSSCSILSGKGATDNKREAMDTSQAGVADRFGISIPYDEQKISLLEDKWEE